MYTQNYPSWLVPLDIAQQLKEIGFDDRCSDTIPLPTWEQVFSWFRTNGFHGHVCVSDDGLGGNEYDYCIDYLTENTSIFSEHPYNTYEEAREALVRRLIQLIINH